MFVKLRELTHWLSYWVKGLCRLARLCSAYSRDVAVQQQRKERKIVAASTVAYETVKLLRVGCKITSLMERAFKF